MDSMEMEFIEPKPRRVPLPPLYLPKKVVFVGDGGVGKTSFVRSLLTPGEFNRVYVPTVGAEVHHLEKPTMNVMAEFQLWDTAGQEKFAGDRYNYYKDAGSAIVMFDVTSSISYKNVKQWIQDIRAVRPDIPIKLVANKCDITGSSRKVFCTTELINGVMVDKRYNLPYYETSVKTRTGFGFDGGHLFD